MWEELEKLTLKLQALRATLRHKMWKLAPSHEVVTLLDSTEFVGSHPGLEDLCLKMEAGAAALFRYYHPEIWAEHLEPMFQEVMQTSQELREKRDRVLRAHLILHEPFPVPLDLLTDIEERS